MVAVVLCLGCVLAAGLQLLALRGALFTPRMDRLKDPPPPQWPRLSVIVAACNEATTLEAALNTLLAQTYPNLELVVVNDRSTDATGDILDRMAAADPRVLPVHIHTLPEGWLGKVHAFHQAAQKATGSLLLFTDADVHFAPGVLHNVVAAVEAQKLDHVTVFPQMKDLSVPAEMAVAAFGNLLLGASNAPGVARPGARAVVGVGAFNLVRRDVLMRSLGMEWIRMDVADDLALAILMREAGARRMVLLGCGLVSLQWYPSLPAMVRGLEKNMFGAAGRYSVARMLGLVLALLLMVLCPYAALFHPWPLVQGLGALALGLSLVMGVAAHKVMGIRVVPALLMQPGLLFTAYAMARSMVVVLRDGGVRWRGAFYPLGQLKEGLRVHWATVRPGRAR